MSSAMVYILGSARYSRSAAVAAVGTAVGVLDDVGGLWNNEGRSGRMRRQCATGLSHSQRACLLGR